MHILKALISFFCLLAGIVCSLMLALLVFFHQIQSPDPLLQAYAETRIGEQLVPALSRSFVTDDVLVNNSVRFMTLAQAQDFVAALFPHDWVDAHMELLIRQATRLIHPGAHIQDSVLIVSLEEPKSMFVSSFEALKPSIVDKAFGDVFARMDPRAITETVPNELNLLHLFTHVNSENESSHSYDMLGLEKFSGPLSVEEQDALVPIQEKIDFAQSLHNSVRTLIPLMVALIVAIGFICSRLHYDGSGHRVLQWWGYFFFAVSLPFIASGIVLRWYIEPLIVRALSDIPDAFAALVAQYAARYGTLLSSTHMIVAIALCACAVVCFWTAPHLHKRPK